MRDADPVDYNFHVNEDEFRQDDNHRSKAADGIEEDAAREEEGEDTNKNDEEEDDDEDEDEEQDILVEKIKDMWEMHPGPRTAANKLRCDEFGAKVMAKAQALAKELNKPTRNILLQAGLLTRNGRSPGLVNEY
jgi:hypothetical protein